MTPMPVATKAHIWIAAIWIPLVLFLGIVIAVQGNTEAALARARGADLKARTDLSYEIDRLQGQLGYESSAATIDVAVRRLNLNLQPPVKVAAR